MYKLFSLFFHKKHTLTKETDTIKNGAVLKNLHFGMLKLTKPPILPNCQVQNGFFVNLIIQELKFCKSAQLFIVSVSLARGFFERMREDIVHIFQALDIGCKEKGMRENIFFWK